MQIEWSEKYQRFYAVMNYSNFDQEKESLKGAGFKFNWENKRWETNQYQIAKKFLYKCTTSAMDAIQKLESKTKENLIKSLSTTTTFEPKHPFGLEYFPFQKAGIEGAIGDHNAFLVYEPGLGKTIMAIGMINELHPDSVLIVCRTNDIRSVWLDMLKQWLIYPYGISVVSQTHKLSSITIIGYDMVAKMQGLLLTKKWDIMILDESHYIKNYKTKRSHAVREIAKSAKKKVAMTGSPALRRPWDIWNQLRYLEHYLGNNWKLFMDNFAEQDFFGNYIKGKNIPQLQKILRESGIYFSQTKADVLPELPKKIRQVLVIPNTLSKSETLKHDDIIRKYFSLEETVANIDSIKIPFEEFAPLRHEIGIKKVPFVIDHVENLLEEEDKIVIFAHHHDVMGALYEHFRDISVFINGETPMNKRPDIISRFQNDPAVRLFIGSIETSGMGITLTSSACVVFAEFDPTAEIMNQCEDRLHRIGQKDTVLVHHIVMENTVDARITRIIVDKQSEMDQLKKKDYLVGLHDEAIS
ncbi:MAG: DEAD/DEAH box helicase [Thermoplasmataceae archaeon]